MFTYTPPAGLGGSLYTVCNDAHLIPGFGSGHFYDHTSATAAGQMLLAWDDPNPTNAWSQIVNVCPNNYYDFSFWLASLHTGPLESVTVVVQDGSGTPTTYGPYTSTAYDTWKNFNFSWFNASSSTATITIYSAASPITNQAIFGLDDISFIRRSCTIKPPMDIYVYYPGIGVPGPICAGSTVVATTCRSGSFSSDATSVATVDASGNVSGLTGGSANIKITDAITGCTATASVTVNANSLSGLSSVCTDNTITWTATTPGTWSCTGNLTNLSGSGTMLSCMFKGGAAGTGYIHFVNGTTHCTSDDTITVNPIPVISLSAPIFCDGSIISATASGSGGTWTCSSPLVLASSGSGSASSFGNTPGAIGDGTIFYTDDATTCSNSITVHVNPVPPPFSIENICVGSTFTYHDAISGGTWTSSSPSVATIGATSGLATGMSAFSTTITYTLPPGCSTSNTLNVFDCSGTGVAGGGEICQGSTETFFSFGLPPGGTWSCDSHGTINATTGFFTALSGPSCTITYTVGGVPHSTTIAVIPPTHACVTTVIISGVSYFNFTSDCTDPDAIITFEGYDYIGDDLGSVTTPVGMYSYAAIAAMFTSPVGNLVKVCVTKVKCFGCTWESTGCCAKVNPPERFANTTATQTILPGNDEPSFMIVPNPNTGTFTIKGIFSNMPDLKSVAMHIIDMFGKDVYTNVLPINNNGEVDSKVSLPNMPNGVYFVKIYGEKCNTTLRFIIAR